MRPWTHKTYVRSSSQSLMALRRRRRTASSSWAQRICRKSSTKRSSGGSRSASTVCDALFAESRVAYAVSSGSRLYLIVPLPDNESREVLLRHLLASQKTAIGSRDMAAIVRATAGYSGSDLKALCKDAAMGPIRELGARITQVKTDDVRGINARDFDTALTRVRPSVSSETVASLLAWNDLYGVSAAAVTER